MLHALLHVFLVAWGPPLLGRPCCLLVSMLLLVGKVLLLWFTASEVSRGQMRFSCGSRVLPRSQMPLLIGQWQELWVLPATSLAFAAILRSW
jgi:hypothetical protein